jgi:hypothetical protein
MPGIKGNLAAEGVVLFIAILFTSVPAAGKAIQTQSEALTVSSRCPVKRAIASKSDALLASPVHPAGSVETQESSALLISPKHPLPGGIMRVLATLERDIGDARIVVNGPAGPLEPLKTKDGGGPPFWRSAEFQMGPEGGYTVSLVERRKTVGSLEVSISATAPPRKPTSAVWESEMAWGRDAEALYSAWIDALFHDADERSSWPALHEVTRSQERNILYNHLGLGEDDPAGKTAVVMVPDCADNPFYLRAYFAWKLGLPFGFHESDRGTIDRPPRTGRWTTNASPAGKANPVQAFNSFLRNVMNTIHSGTARARLEDDNSDYYPVSLTREALRPGVVYADPYGHTLVIVRWVPQTGDRPGALLAVDAQPDGTVGIKRFWKGNFLFTTSEVIGEPGFKAFRPIVMGGGLPRLLKNEEIAKDLEYGNVSLQQKMMESAAFYETMERLINPKPLDPETAFRDLFQALYEQLIVRVESVANGEAYMKAHPGAVIPMPGSAAAVFQAGGLWEDYSTPNRDMRLLIAMDTLLNFPDTIVRSPGSYKLPKRKTSDEVKKDLEALARKWAAEMSISYIRSNGTAQILTIEDILNRKDAFEMGYNPNDGIELRWGAPEGSPEFAACRRRAPAGQQERMRSLRFWFRKRLHPTT